MHIQDDARRGEDMAARRDGEPILVAVNTERLRSHLERHLGRAGCLVRRVGATEVMVTVMNAEAREEAEIQLDAYLQVWERRNAARGGRAWRTQPARPESPSAR